MVRQRAVRISRNAATTPMQAACTSAQPSTSARAGAKTGNVHFISLRLSSSSAGWRWPAVLQGCELSLICVSERLAEHTLKRVVWISRQVFEELRIQIPVSQ